MSPKAEEQLEAADPWCDLMVAGQAGNGGAYRRLLDEIGAWLQRFYARHLPPAFVADAVQEALLAVHLKRHTYAPDRPFRPWLAAIARYKWIDRLRTLKREGGDELHEDSAAVGDHGEAVTSATVLDALLGRLKPAQAAVIRMVKLQGYSIEDAAQATGQSPSLVKVNIHRGLSRLSVVVQDDRDAA